MNSFKFGHAYITGIEWGILESTRLSLERQRERQRAEYDARQRESIQRYVQDGDILAYKQRYYGI